MKNKDHINFEFGHGNRGQTICWAFKGRRTIPSSIGFAFCRKDDWYDRTTGEKTSLQRAIDNLNLPKERRAEVWIEYFDWVSKGRP